MTYTRKRALCWLYAAIMTAALMTYVLLGTGMELMVDDVFIQHQLQGFETGRPLTFHLFIHGVLVWPLALLTQLFPGLPWFAYAQLFLLAASAVVFSKAVMQCFLRHQKPLWTGVAVAVSVLLIFFFERMASITYTHTATLAGMAAVMQMFSIDHGRGSGRVVLGMGGALALVVCAYTLRQVVLLPLLAFCGIAYLILVLEEYGKAGGRPLCSVKPMIFSLVMIAAVLGGLLCVREWEKQRDDAADYLKWRDAYVNVMDYYGMESVPQEAFELVGWDEATQAMAQEWCFLNPDISTEAFLTLTDYMEQQDQRTLEQRLRAAWITFYRVVKFSPLEIRCLSMFAIAAAAAFVGMCWNRHWRMVLYAIPVVVCMSVMLLMLALSGRLPIRAMYPAVLPAGAIVLGVLPACYRTRKPEHRRTQKSVLGVCCLLMMVFSLWCFSDLLDKLPARDEAAEPAIADLESYALTVPEHLIIYDGSMADTDQRVFPRYPDGIPVNITFWGGWGMRSPQNVELFERFGIELDAFSPNDFFREEVFLASASVGEEETCLIENWMEAELGVDVKRVLYAQHGKAYIYRFERNTEGTNQT